MPQLVASGNASAVWVGWKGLTQVPTSPRGGFPRNMAPLARVAARGPQSRLPNGGGTLACGGAAAAAAAVCAAAVQTGYSARLLLTTRSQRARIASRLPGGSVWETECPDYTFSAITNCPRNERQHWTGGERQSRLQGAFLGLEFSPGRPILGSVAIRAPSRFAAVAPDGGSQLC